MRATSALPRFRAVAISRMQSTVTIRRKSGGVWSTILTSQARLGAMGSSATADARTKPLVAAGVRWEMQAQRVLHLPYTVTDLQDGDQITVTAGDNAGTFWRIVESSWQDQSTARRVAVSQIAGADDAGFFGATVVTVQTYLGVNTYGEEWDTAKTVNAWVNDQTTLVRSSKGDEVTSQAVILVPLDTLSLWVENSLVTLPGDATPRRVIVVNSNDVTGLPLPEHVEVHLT